MAGGRDQQQDQEATWRGIWNRTDVRYPFPPAMVNNTTAIIVTCPIAKKWGKIRSHQRDQASLVDIFCLAHLLH